VSPVLLVPFLLFACESPPDETGGERAAAASRTPAPTLTQPTVVMIVMDTVRADHLSLCGYERATSPRLEAFAAQPGTVHTCRAYAPGSWTLPSHASFFTGLPVDGHGAHMIRGGIDDGQDWLSLRPLDEEAPTLAETLGDAGYQSVLLSANPMLSPEFGLARGFDVVHVAQHFGVLRGAQLERRLRTTLAEDVDPDKPLFLFVNLTEAHVPLQNPAPGHPWYTPSDYPDRRRMRRLLGRNTLGRHPDPEAASRWFTDLYDVGVQRADQTFGRVIDTLEQTGWLGVPHRITVTSDHGEHLGAFGYFGHGGDTLEPNTRVALVHRQHPVPLPSLPEPFPGVAVHGLVRDGAVPSPLPAAEAIAMPWAEKASASNQQTAIHADAALWEGTRKHRTVGGSHTTVDLVADPLEQAGTATDPAADAKLGALEARLRMTSGRPAENNPEVIELLKAAGYMSD